MTRYVGTSVPRTEDARLIRGQGHYLADLVIPGMLEAAVVRSQDASGVLRSVDVTDALAVPGVVAVLTAADLPESARAITRSFYVLTPQFVERHSVNVLGASEPVLASEPISRVGEPIALVVAADRYSAEDGREAVMAEVDPSDAVVDPEAALTAGSPQVDPTVPGNLHGRFEVVVGTPDQARQGAGHRVAARFRIGRSVGSPIENRGVVAHYVDDLLTVWSTTQDIPHVLRSYLAPMLGLEEERIRVIAPDMGGSFGGGVYPEEVFVPLAAMRLGRPVRWVEKQDLSGPASLPRSTDRCRAGFRRRWVVPLSDHADPPGLRCRRPLRDHAPVQRRLPRPWGVSHRQLPGRRVVRAHQQDEERPVRGQGVQKPPSWSTGSSTWAPTGWGSTPPTSGS